MSGTIRQSQKIVLKGSETAFIDACSNLFSGLSECADGEILSAKGALSASTLAAKLYVIELKNFQRSGPSSESSKKLKTIASAALKLRKAIESVNHNVELITDELSDLLPNELLRIETLLSDSIRMISRDAHIDFDVYLSHQEVIFEKLKMVELSGDDITFIKSRLGSLLRKKEYNLGVKTIKTNMFDQLEALAEIAIKASKNPKISNHKGGSLTQYQETRLFPSQLLVRECMAILVASRMSFGSSKVGNLNDLASCVQEYAVNSSGGVRTAIEEVGVRSSAIGIPLDRWIDYRVAKLLLDDLKLNLPKGKRLIGKRGELERRVDGLRTWFSRQVTMKPGPDGKIEVWHKPEIRFDADSPFG